jgi:hypothetical protein
MICLSENTHDPLKNYLRQKGHRIAEIKKTASVYDAVSDHTDLYLCRIKKEVILSPEQAVHIDSTLEESGISYILGSPLKGSSYPYNIAYNAAWVGSYLIHKLQYTDSSILKMAEQYELQTVHVKQGYTKCNLVVVDERSLITSDQGIAASLAKYPLDILLISKGHVCLKGFAYGFLGGASGRVDDEMIFNGDLSAHPDFKRITDFIENKGLNTVYFRESPLEDIGSIFQL